MPKKAKAVPIAAASKHSRVKQERAPQPPRKRVRTHPGLAPAEAAFVGLWKHGGADDVVSAYRALAAPTPTRLNQCLSACARCGAVDAALALLRERQAARDAPVPNCVSFSVCINGAGKAGRTAEALELLDALLAADGVVPDTVAFNAAIAACAPTADWRAAERTLRRAEATSGAAPDVITYNALGDVLSRAGRHAALEKLVASMERGKPRPRPNGVTYATLVASLARAAAPDAAAAVRVVRERMGALVNLAACNAALDCCAKAGAAALAEALLATMLAEARFPRPDAASVRCALAALCAGGRRGAADALLGRVEAGDYGTKVVADYPMFHTVMQACGAEGDLDPTRLARLKARLEASGAAALRALATYDGNKTCVNGRAGSKKGDAALAESCEAMVANVRSKTGYDFDTAALPFAFLVDADGADRAERARHSLTYHAEKKALSAALRATPSGETVAVAVNIAMCDDCHNMFAFASKAYGRTITCTETQSKRKHAFARGSCNCPRRLTCCKKC